MSKGEKNLFKVLFVCLAIGIISVVASHMIPQRLPDGCVITKEYLSALKWRFVSERLETIGIMLSMFSFTFILISVIKKVRRSYFTTKQKMIFAVFVIGAAGMILILLPKTVMVAFGQPKARVERVLSKGETSDEVGNSKPAFLLADGYYAVDSTMYSIYSPGDEVISISCGGVPMEVHQAEVWSIDEELQ